MWLCIDANNEISRISINVRFTFSNESMFLTICHTKLNFKLKSSFFINKLDIWTFITNLLLGHLEASGTKLPRYHLHPSEYLALDDRGHHQIQIQNQHQRSWRRDPYPLPYLLCPHTLHHICHTFLSFLCQLAPHTLHQGL